MLPSAFLQTCIHNPQLMNFGQKIWSIVLETLDDAVTAQQIGAICPLRTQKIQFKQIPIGKRCVVHVPPIDSGTIWDDIYLMAEKADELGLNVEIEPLHFDNFPVSEHQDVNSRAAGAGFDYMGQWPPITTGKELPLGWHLDDDHSQLGTARDAVWEMIKCGEIEGQIKIAHLDTGISPDHPALKPNKGIRMDLSRNFIDSEKESNPKAIDLEKGGMEQQGHGTGTLGILAGWKIDSRYTDNEDIGFIGAIPFATVIPMRVADSVMIFNTENFTEALEEAIRLGCEVVTMSMGGKPSRRMAKVINKAYEAGITVVTAAGNFITQGIARIGPPTVIYPARFTRVIAACGVCSNDLPYDFDAQMEFGNVAKNRGLLSTDFMQGNWGPTKAMKYAIAAYTPNVPWLVDDSERPIKKSGGGTSSATPQVAAAAALWIVKNRKTLDEKGYTGTWKQVEAVRKALFQTAQKYSFEYWDTYFGNGILKAKEALNVEVPEISDTDLTPACESTWHGIVEAFNLFFNRKKSFQKMGQTQRNMLVLEAEGLLLEHPELLDQKEVQTRSLVEEEKVVNQLIELVQTSQHCSNRLRQIIQSPD